MNTEPGNALVSGTIYRESDIATDSDGHPDKIFTLPATTSFRFALLAVAVTASSVFVYQGIYLASPRGAVWQSKTLSCLSQALARPSGLSGAFGAALEQAAICRSHADRAEALWALLGVSLLVVLAVTLYWIQPWWYRRLKRLSVLTREEAPTLLGRLEQLRRQAGVGRIVWLLQPFNVNVSAFTFGRFRRRYVTISGGAAVTAVRQPATFDAVVLHELAHIKNRDIDQTYLAVVIWRAFVIGALLPMVVLLIVSRQLDPPQRVLWRTALLALIVYLLRNWVVRSREFDADARVRVIAPDTSLAHVLAAAPTRRKQLFRQLSWLHPSNQQRAAALLNPEPLFRCGVWDGIALGVVAALGASAAQDIGFLLTATSPLGSLASAAIFAPFVAAALVATMWRSRLLPTETAAPIGWPVGLGLGIGLAVGPIIALPTALDQGIAPDSASWSTISVLGVWVGLCIVVFASVPVWIGHWADAWQKPLGKTTPRVPSRIGMFVAIGATSIALAVGLDLLLTCFTFVGPVATDPVTRHELGQAWMIAGPYIAQQPGAWILCLAVIAVPVAGLVSGYRGRPARRNAALYQRHSWVHMVRVALVGALASVVLALSINACVHFGVAEPVRWNVYFFGRLILFEQQAIVVVALVFALIATASIRPSQLVAMAAVLAAAVAAAGVITVDNTGSIGSCIGLFNVWYIHPSAGECPTFPSASYIIGQVHQSAVGAALLSIIAIPAAYHVGRRISSLAENWTALTKKSMAFRCISGVMVMVVAAGAVSWWAIMASSHGIKPAGSIGQDGWLQGTGYEIRLRPYWYNVAATNKPGQMHLAYSFGDATLYLESDPTNERRTELLKAKLLQLGAHQVRIDGTAGLRIGILQRNDDREDIWFVSRNNIQYMVTLMAPAEVALLAEGDATLMLQSWRWTGPG